MRKLFSSNKPQKAKSWKKIRANESHSSSISDSFPTKHSASSLSSQRTSRTLVESHSEPIPMPVRSLSLPPTLAMPKPRYTVYPTQDLLKSFENEKTQIENSSDELSESGTEDMPNEIPEKKPAHKYKYHRRRQSIVNDSILKMNNVFEPISPQSIQETSPTMNNTTRELLNNSASDNDSSSEDDGQTERQQQSSSSQSLYRPATDTAPSSYTNSTDMISKNTSTSSPLENITKPSTIDSFVSRPISSSELSATSVTQNIKNKYTKKKSHDKPHASLQNFSSEQEQQQQQRQLQQPSMSDSTASLLSAEIQSQLQKLALREDLEDLRRVIDKLNEQSMRDREEYLERVKEQKKVEKEIFNQINIAKQRLDEMSFERNQTIQEESQPTRATTSKKRDNLPEQPTTTNTRRYRRSQPYLEQQQQPPLDDSRYFYEHPSSRNNYDILDYPLPPPRSFMYEMDDYNQPFYMDDYMYNFDQQLPGYGYPSPHPRKHRPRSKSADFQRMNFDNARSMRHNSSGKSSVRSTRSNRSRGSNGGSGVGGGVGGSTGGINKEGLDEHGYHSAAEEEEDIPRYTSLRPNHHNTGGSSNSNNKGREQRANNDDEEEEEEEREAPTSRHSSKSSTAGRFRRRPSNNNNGNNNSNVGSSIPHHLMYHNPGFRPPPHPPGHYFSPHPGMNPGRVNERERHGAMPYNMGPPPPGNEYYVGPQGLSPRNMGFSEGRPPPPPMQSMGWPPNGNQSMYGIPPHHPPPPPPGAGGNNSTMNEPPGNPVTGAIPNYESGQDSVNQHGMRRYTVQQRGYQPMYPDSGQMVFLQ